MSIYRKLKEYIKEEKSVTHAIFGTLNDRKCEFGYETEHGWKTYQPCGIYWHDYDFLLEYYVMGIMPKYKIENDKIIPYIHITLQKDIDTERKREEIEII